MTNLNLSLLIKRAILSEKTYKQMGDGLYTFLVDRRSTKIQIAQAVEKQFQVNVVRVNVLKKPHKTIRIAKTRKTTQITGGKKATVLLKKGERIEILSPKTAKESKSKSTKAAKGRNTDQEEKPKTRGKKGLLARIKK